MADDTIEHAASADEQRVIGAFRLGWTLAELRGRIRLGDQDVCMPPPPAGRSLHDLPLSTERSAKEQQIQAKRVLVALADVLGVNPAVNQLSGFSRSNGKTSDFLENLIREGVRSSWSGESRETFFELIWSWDAWIQDKLAEGPFGASSAYQLGRGLAEISWGLDPDSREDDKSWSSWSFLLSRQRVESLGRLVDRLAAYFHENTPAAIKGSLEAWRDAVEGRRVQGQPQACERLRLQAERWRDVVVAGLDPCVFADQHSASSLARTTRVTTRLAGAIWPQLVFGILSVVVLIVAVLVMPEDASGGTAVAILGGLGITASSVSARAKAQANALLTQARNSYREQLAIEATTLLPLPTQPKGSGALLA